MTAINLAKPDDFPRIDAMVARFHDEMGIASTDDSRNAALSPLLDGSPLGAIYILGPVKAPVGYVVITFGWSVEFGGMDGFIDEIWIRPSVRRRGLATEALLSLSHALSGAGLRALHLEVRKDDESTQRLYRKNNCAPREEYLLMSKSL
jgi:ribosomal protein S18 acetylase RimI-like enzyme